MADFIYKKARDLEEGDRIVSSISGHAVFFDRVSEIRFVKDGKVHVDLNNWTATQILSEEERVRVLVTAPRGFRG